MHNHQSLSLLITHLKSAFNAQEQTHNFFYNHLLKYNTSISNCNTLLKNEVNQLAYYYQTNLNNYTSSTSTLHYQLKLFKAQNFILQNKLLHKNALITSLSNSISSLNDSQIEQQKCLYKKYTNQIKEVHLTILDEQLEMIDDMLSEIKEIVLNEEIKKKELNELNEEIRKIKMKIGCDYNNDNNTTKMDVVLTEKTLLDNSNMLMCKLQNKLK